MTDDLERDLRTMLAERAGDIRTVPQHVLTVVSDPTRIDVTRIDVTDNAVTDNAVTEPDPAAADAEVIDLGLRLGDALGVARRRWPLLLAAAAILAAAGSVLALLPGGTTHHTVHPAHQALRMVTRQSCASTLPTSWRKPLTASTTRVASLGGGDVVGVTDSGGAVVEQNAPDMGSGFTTRLGYLPPGSSSVRWLGAFSRHYASTDRATIHSFGLAVDTTGNTAIVSVQVGGRAPQTREIVTVDLASGRRTVLARSSKQADLGQRQGYGQNGIVYWEADRPSPQHPHRVVRSILSRAVDGGPTTVEASGGVYDLEKSALGIEWNLDNGPVDRPAEVPALVARHAAMYSLTGNVFDSYVTDGQVYAWQTLQGDLEWYDPSTGDLVRIPKLLGAPGVYPGQAALYIVAGPLVYYQDRAGTDRVIDVRTGAVIPAPNTGELFGSRGTAVGEARSLGPVGSGNLLRVDTADLPPVRC